MNRDLTVGKPESVLWKFCVPLFGSIIFQQLYNIADSFVAGKFIGENALAAVGNSYEITLIFIAFAFGCNIGCSVIVSQLFGAKQYRDMKTAISTSLIASGVVCVVLMLFGLLGCSELLQLIRTPETIFADSKLCLDFHFYSTIMLQPEFFQHWAIPRRRSFFWQFLQLPIFLWTCCLFLHSIWALQEWHGLPFSVRGQAVSCL